MRVRIGICIGVICMIFSCRPTITSEQSQENEPSQAETTEIAIQAEAFEVAGEGFTKTEDGRRMVSGEEKAWLEYEVDIPVTGRYKVQIALMSQNSDAGTIWIEDYVDNKDGRTYNITSNIPVNPSEGEAKREVLVRDGSPLSAGIHRIRLHVDGAAGVQVDDFQFSLIRPHKDTPKIQEQKTDGENWELVWSDEFETDGAPDTSIWTYDIGDWGWGNNELQYYTVDRRENARIENGSLIIEARKNDLDYPWTSARLTTRGKVSFLYGRIEFRAKIPVEKGNWAAGWTLGDDYRDELSWPYCGEIDILESVGYEVDNETGDGTAHASVHCGAYYFKLGNQPTSILDVKNMHDEFHTYAVDWTPQGIKAYVDDQEYFNYEDTSTELAWPFDKPQNIILNLAMGGGWGGLQGMDETVTSQQFIVDYVRVYERR